ncbi:Gfo/Idh/MocA family oxidoreductase [Denitratisoma sp. agr-D3]
MDAPNRILVVGLGSIGRRHARLVRQAHPQTRVAALRRTGQADLEDGLVDMVFHSVADAMDRFAPQVAIIANPASLHLDYAMELALAGVHLLVEKPLAPSKAGVAELIAVCRRQKVVLAVGYNLRFSASLREFRNQLSRVGTLCSVRAEVGQYLPSWRPGADYREGASASRALGGGALLELSHEMDYLCWVFGDAAWVSARMGRQSTLEIDVEDTVHLVLGLNRPEATAPLMVRLDMDFLRHDTVRQCIAIGTAGSLRWNGFAGTVEFFAEGASTWQTVFSHTPVRDETYMLQWQHFLECVLTGAAPLVDGEAGLQVLKLADAARLSSDLSRVVTLE